MYNAHEQRKEIETIKERTVKLNLSDADCKRIAEKAGEAGFTVGQLLESFIGDLVHGTYTNGSDERMYANAWFDRCWFGSFPEDTLLKRLLQNHYDIDIFEFIDLLDEINELEDSIADCAADPTAYDEDDQKYLTEDLNDLKEQYNHIVDDYLKDYKDAGIKKEVENCVRWVKDYQKFQGEID